MAETESDTAITAVITAEAAVITDEKDDVKETIKDNSVEVSDDFLQSSISLSQHLHSELSKLTYDPSFPDTILPFLQDVDAYLSLTDESQAQLPPLDWNRVFRKAYSICLWIRLSIDQTTVLTTQPNSTGRKLLYRISTHPEDPSGVGVCVTVGDWLLYPDGTVTTSLTAFALPPKQSLAQLPLQLKANTWHLLSISHIFPYLKRPQWMVSVDGSSMGVADVPYPVMDSNVSMGYCTLLSNITQGGVTILSKDQDDSKKPASELNEARKKNFHSIAMDIASISVYPDVIPPPMLALLSSAGPQLSLQSHGKIITLLPPVDNWTKGSSLRGVNVGIPLGVSGGALELQRLSSKSVYFFSAANAKVFSSRIVLPMQYLPGETDSTPKVGLIQPGIGTREEEGTSAALYVFGNNITIHHLLSTYLLQCREAIDTHLFDVTKLFSISILEQGLVPNIVMPFFLANLPPSFGLNLQQPLYTKSLTLLYNLYTQNGMWASKLITLLSTTIRHGGGRVHELVLQSGLLHVLGSTLRQSLLRAQQLQVYAHSTVEDFLSNVQLDMTYWQPTHAQACPKIIPADIFPAMATLIQVCCGVRPGQSARWTSLTYIERSSDLAMTAVFGLALNLDLWGNQCSTILGVICDAYANVQGGHLLRHEIPIQTLMDLLRTRLTNEKDEVSTHLANLVQHMLLSSLSNRNIIGQAERDIACCMGVLSDSPLGSLGGHVILCSLSNIMDWCNQGKDDDEKLHIATRLARNLMVSQFHDVVAPMLLSRSFFCCAVSTNSMSGSWESHWRMVLTLFAWVASIAGQEGTIAAQSTGALLLASGVAGSLTHCVAKGIGELYLPAPTMTLMVGKQDAWSYTELLTDRLSVMMPFFPGLLVSVLSNDMNSKALNIVIELVTAVCGAVHRVVAGSTQLLPVRRGRKVTPSIGSKLTLQHVPYLLLASVLLEHHIRPRESILEGTVILTANGDCGAPQGDDKMEQLKSSQRSILSTLTDLISQSMCELSTELWTMIICTLKESFKYGASAETPQKSEDFGKVVAHDMLCRIVAIVLTKVQTREYEWEMWPVEMCSAIARLIDLVEEKDLLLIAMDKGNSDTNRSLSRDQILLLCALSDVMAYGRDMTGWCQLLLPTPPEPLGESSDLKANQSSEIVDLFPQEESVYSTRTIGNSINVESLDGRYHFTPPETPGASSKLLLPILQPCLRIMLVSVGNVRSGLKICIPDIKPSEKSLLLHVADELKETMTAAIVGLTFSNSRDVALNCMASLRRASVYHKNIHDMDACTVCSTLFVTVVEETRVRYEGERRKRDRALFDAFEDERLGAASESQEVERMLLGNTGVLPGMLTPAVVPKEGTEEIDFYTSEYKAIAVTADSIANADIQDFVMFPEENSEGNYKGWENILRASGDHGKMGWDQYKGLGSALDDCSFLVKSSINDNVTLGPEAQVDIFLSLLTPYLDTWDKGAAKEIAETEVVKIFDDMKVSAEMVRQGSNRQNDTAADAMSTYIEMASTEKARLAEVVKVFLPSHRYSCQAYSARYCWSKFFELAQDRDKCSMESLWERGISDGNRDIRSRLITMPCNPQFKRFIPKHLDHSHDTDESQTEPPQLSSEYSTVTANDSEENEKKTLVRPSVEEVHSALMGAGNLAIIDITKKQIVDDELPELLLDQDGIDNHDDEEEFGDGSLGFPSRGGDDDDTVRSVGGDASSTDPLTVDDENIDSYNTSAAKATDRTYSGVHHNIASSLYSHPPDNSSSILTLMHSTASNMIEKSFDACLHVKAEGSRKCTMLLSATHLILEYDTETEGLYEGEMMAVREEAERQKIIDETGGGHDSSQKEGIEDQLERRQREMAAMRPKSIRWNLSELSHVYLRRYRLRDSAVEMFFIPSGGSSYGGFGLYSPSTSLFLDFGSGKDGNRRRDEASHAIMRRSPPQTIKQWPDKSGQFLHEQLSRLTLGWVEGRITNFDYLLHLNMLAGRSYNDLCQYPVMPWVLSNYTSEQIPDLTDRSNFRDLSKPMGALNPRRLVDFMERFETFADPTIPPFMYGSHYSTSAGVVLHFLVRMHPFAGLHRQLQGGNFDVADRLFSSISRTWDMCTGFSAAEVKELTPEWYCNPGFLKNSNNFMLGTSQDREVIDNVILPPWAQGSPECFIEVMRNALESDLCTEMLPDWIDLIFGRKQQGPEAIKSHNVFFYLTYYGSVDVALIEDEGLRQATELQIAHFGQCPMQLFVRPHVRNTLQNHQRRQKTFYQMLSAYCQGAGIHDQNAITLNSELKLFGKQLFLPFFSAPSRHSVHLDPPPPGPHVPLIGVRLAGIDRCLAVDANGTFHSFRWAWKPDPLESSDDNAKSEIEDNDKHEMGCFIAQRELPRFRTVPRLIHVTKSLGESIPAVGISKTLFASRSVLLVLSDADGRGGLAMQLVDPAKASIKGEAIVPAVHSAKVTCIAMDPIGTAAGHGGVGGELAIIGSADGNSSLWRFMSSHYLPLRPRIRMRGHTGAKIHAVAISSAIHICASVSAHQICIFSVGNGAMIRSWHPPTDTLKGFENDKTKTIFADTPALCLSVQGFICTVCKTFFFNEEDEILREVITLHLFSLEGISIGSKPLESWRGTPSKMTCTPDGTAVLVCGGRGVTVHRLSAIMPLDFIDEWHITETEELDDKLPHAFDVDFGPSLMRPIVGAVALSGGALRLHALPGITAWSERHKARSGLGIGQALSKPAGRLKDALGRGFGFGKSALGVGKNVTKEVSTEIKDKGVGGFLSGTLFRKTQK